VAPVQLGGGDSEAEFGKAVQERPEGELALHAWQRGTETVVEAMPERVSPLGIFFSLTADGRGQAGESLVSARTP